MSVTPLFATATAIASATTTSNDYSNSNTSGSSRNCTIISRGSSSSRGLEQAPKSDQDTGADVLDQGAEQEPCACQGPMIFGHSGHLLRYLDFLTLRLSLYFLTFRGFSTFRCLLYFSPFRCVLQ